MMSTFYSPPVGRSIFGRRSSLLATLAQWYVTYLAWRAENLAIADFRAMSDRQLADIGLMRSQVVQSAASDRTLSHHD